MRRAVVFTVILGIGSLGCGVLERQTYFTATVDPRLLSGPAKLPCGWVDSEGPPDRVTYRVGTLWVSIDAKQEVEPYLFGPWFASVIPVFPVTWLVEALAHHYLTLNFDADPATLPRLKSWNLLVLVPTNADSPRVVGTSLGRYASPHQARFPADWRSLETFTLRLPRVDNVAKDLDIPFVKARRWAWVQLSPNC